MPRNFYNRVEVMFPITSPVLREKIRGEIVAPIMTDNCRAYELGEDGVYTRRKPVAGELPRDAQQTVLNCYFPQVPSA